MNKHKLIGFILLIVGVSLCAAASARLTEPVNAALVAKHSLGQQAEAAQAAADTASEAAQAADAAASEAAQAAAAQAAQAAQAAADAAKAAPIILPKDRLSQWLSAFGALFGVGMALVVAGAVLARRAVKAEAEQAPQASTNQAATIQIPADFGHMLRDLASRLHALLQAHPLADALPDGAAAAIQADIEAIQADYIERLTAAPVRARIQLRYGIEGLAALFSPLSAAERRVNRAWSALIDRHWPEARSSLTEAHAHIVATAETLQALQPPRP